MNDTIRYNYTFHNHLDVKRLIIQDTKTWEKINLVLKSICLFLLEIGERSKTLWKDMLLFKLHMILKFPISPM